MANKRVASKGGKRHAPVKPAPKQAPAVSPALAKAFEAFKAGRLDEAERAYSALIAAQPKLAVAHNHLGLILKAKGQFDRAEALLRRAIELDPKDVSGHTNLGNLLMKLGRVADADTSYARALEIGGTEDALLNRAWSRYSLNDGAGALDLYSRAVAKNPNSARGHNGRGLALALLGRTAEAEEAYRKANAADPRFSGALNNLGVLLKRLSRYNEACEAYGKALAIDPNSAEAHNNLGCALQEMGRLDEAKSSFRRALALAPGYADAMGNLGNAHLAGLELDDALATYGKAATLGPARADFGLHRSFVHLLRGEFREGWDAYESRLGLPELADRFRAIRLPRWDGRKLDAGRLLVVEEQGLGDTLQVLRFIPTVAARAGKVALSVSPAIRRLIPNWASVEIIEEGATGADVWTPLLSLPRALGIGADNMRVPTPYLILPPGLVDSWRKRVGAHGFKVGLVWSGSAGHRRDRERSIAPEMLAPLFRIPGLRLFSLQKVHTPGALETLRSFGSVEEFASRLADLAETGAFARAMDVVITVDTSVAHLCGALAVPVWTLINYSPDWRWQLGRADTPWYPTMTLFRQPAPGDWAGAIALAARTLAARAMSAAA